MKIWDALDLAGRYVSSDLSLLGQNLVLCGVKNEREKPYYEHVMENGGRVTIIEPFDGNAEACRLIYPGAQVVLDTAENFAVHSNLECSRFSCVLWIQGPEHVDKRTALLTLSLFRTMATVVVAECPHGIYEQGECEGNPYEAHRSTLYPSDFDAAWEIYVGTDEHPCETANAVRHMMVVFDDRKTVTSS